MTGAGEARSFFVATKLYYIQQEIHMNLLLRPKTCDQMVGHGIRIGEIIEEERKLKTGLVRSCVVLPWIESVKNSKVQLGPVFEEFESVFSGRSVELDIAEEMMLELRLWISGEINLSIPMMITYKTKRLIRGFVRSHR